MKHGVLDQFFLELYDRFGDADGYVPGTDLHPHEIAQLPQRLVTYACLDRCLVPAADRSPILAEALSILSQGFWPAGWQEGRILVW